MRRLGSLAAVLAILALPWPRAAAAAGTVDVPGSTPCST